jgi:predicted amidophosphoribosyltransferase
MHSGKACATNVLVRHRRTRQQVGLTAEERQKNVRRAFDVPLEQRRHIEGKCVLLVDDVRTTGATLAACSDALKAAGASSVRDAGRGVKYA